MFGDIAEEKEGASAGQLTAAVEPIEQYLQLMSGLCFVSETEEKLRDLDKYTISLCASHGFIIAQTDILRKTCELWINTQEHVNAQQKEKLWRNVTVEYVRLMNQRCAWKVNGLFKFGLRLMLGLASLQYTLKGVSPTSLEEMHLALITALRAEQDGTVSASLSFVGVNIHNLLQGKSAQDLAVGAFLYLKYIGNYYLLSVCPGWDNIVSILGRLHHSKLDSKTASELAETLVAECRNFSSTYFAQKFPELWRTIDSSVFHIQKLMREKFPFYQIFDPVKNWYIDLDPLRIEKSDSAPEGPESAADFASDSSSSSEVLSAFKSPEPEIPVGAKLFSRETIIPILAATHELHRHGEVQEPAGAAALSQYPMP